MAEKIEAVKPAPDQTEKEREEHQRIQIQFKVAIQVLEQFFKTVELNKLVTFEEIKEACALDVRKYRHIVESVKRSLRNHHDRVLVNVRGQGYTVADVGRSIAESAGYREKSHNAARISYQIASVTAKNAKTDDERQLAINEQAKSGILEIAWRATENKAIKNTKLYLNQPDESEVIQLLLSKAKGGFK